MSSLFLGVLDVSRFLVPSPRCRHDLAEGVEGIENLADGFLQHPSVDGRGDVGTRLVVEPRKVIHRADDDEAFLKHLGKRFYLIHCHEVILHFVAEKGEELEDNLFANISTSSIELVCR